MHDRQAEILSRMTGDERLKAAETVRQHNLELLRTGILEREGPMSEEALRLRVLEHILPARLFDRFYRRP